MIEEVKEFEDYDAGDPFDQLTGSSDDVILGAYFANTAQAISENDLLTPGFYPVHHMKGQYQVFVEKLTNKTHRIIFQVYTYLEEEYKRHLKETHECWQGRSDDFPMRPVYEVPQWMLIKLLVTQGVHPQIDEQAFERVLAREYPQAWITPSKMPLVR